MEYLSSITIQLKRLLEAEPETLSELRGCIEAAKWVPPYTKTPIMNLNDFYHYLDRMLQTVPVEKNFSNLFHGFFYIISQNGNKLQKDKKFERFRVWMAVYAQQYGSFMNMPESANNLSSFLNFPGFVIDNFVIPPGGFPNFNTFFARYIKPGKRPIGAKTLSYEATADGLAPNPEEDFDLVHKNMADDHVITVPADSVFKGVWPINKDAKVTVSKGNVYSIETLLAQTPYADRFKNGIFTHSYLTVFTYHRYHVPVRGKVLEVQRIVGDVFANVVKDEQGNLGATDGTDYQFTQERGLLILDSPVGLVACLPIGMDIISSVNFTVDVGDYLNKGDEFGNFLFGGSDMILLFENADIDIKVKEVDKLYKLGQVFGVAKSLKK